MPKPLPLAALALIAPGAVAQAALDAEAPIASLLERLGEDVQMFDQHVVTLANPFMEGRIPGSRGMEIASQYMEYWFKKANLQPAFQKSGGSSPWRQPFPLGGRAVVAGERLEVAGSSLAAGTDFAASTLGGSGELTAPVVFVGYGIESGPDDFSSFPDGLDLTGKIALMFRFEPMDGEGNSKWNSRGAWSRYAGFQTKLRGLRRRNAAAALIVNPPGCQDPRAAELAAASGSGRGMPVLQMSTAGGERLLRALGSPSTLAELRALADAGPQAIELPTAATLAVSVERQELVAENVGGLLPGRGVLADEYVVIGGHLDHLGMGEFGSRSGPGALHPGADDNASGAAAVLMLADKLGRAYAELPPETPLRTILFVGFSAEESGLNGARHYVEEPLVPLDKHALMINFDMIGRITKQKLSLSGTYSANGLRELLEPILADTPLEVSTPKSVMMASDHAAFYQKRVPVLFAIIADFHNDYHTPRDTSEKINRVDAVHTIDLFHKIGLAVARRSEPFVFQR